MEIFSDTYFMKEALKEAEKGSNREEVPIGAIIVSENRIIARAHNQVELLSDSTAHAEMLALTSAMNNLGSKYLQGAVIYSTLEPCLMCASAISWAKMSAIVFGAYDKRKGFTTNVRLDLLHPKLEIKGGVLEHECKHTIEDFFQLKRI